MPAVALTSIPPTHESGTGRDPTTPPGSIPDTPTASPHSIPVSPSYIPCKQPQVNDRRVSVPHGAFAGLFAFSALRYPSVQVATHEANTVGGR